MGKEVHEIAVFLEFAKALGLGESARNADPRSPPEPDVFVPDPQAPRYFELGRLLDAEHSRTVLKALRQAPLQVTPDLEKIKLPEREVLRRKLRKTYRTDGHPVDLLLYFDAEALHAAGSLPPTEFSSHANHVMRPLLSASMGPFSRVWVFERFRQTILWRFPSVNTMDG